MAERARTLLERVARILNLTLTRREDILGHLQFEVDLSGFKLNRLTTRTPVVLLANSEATEGNRTQLTGVVNDILFAGGLQVESTLFVLESSDVDVQELVRLYSGHAFVTVEELSAVLEQESIALALTRLISRQIPLSLLSPYEVSEPVTESRFFGRNLELKKITENLDRDYAILGVRRIGKTSLLMEACRRINDQAEGAAVFIHCQEFEQADDFFRNATYKINPRRSLRASRQEFPYFLRHEAHLRGGAIHFFIDEFDSLIELDKNNRWRVLDILKSSSAEKYARFVVSGHRQVLKENIKENSPLYKFLTELSLSSMHRSEAETLIAHPMASLNIRFDHQERIVDQIFTEAGGQPHIMQLYCKGLIERLEELGKSTIAMEDVLEVENDAVFHHMVVSAFIANTNPLEKAVVLATLELDGFTIADAWRELRKQSYPIREDDAVRSTCEHLHLTGILERKSGKYTAATPVVGKLLRRFEEVKPLVSETKRLLGASYDGSQ